MKAYRVEDFEVEKPVRPDSGLHHQLDPIAAYNAALGYARRLTGKEVSERRREAKRSLPKARQALKEHQENLAAFDKLHADLQKAINEAQSVVKGDPGNKKAGLERLSKARSQLNDLQAEWAKARRSYKMAKGEVERLEAVYADELVQHLREYALPLAESEAAYWTEIYGSLQRLLDFKGLEADAKAYLEPEAPVVRGAGADAIGSKSRRSGDLEVTVSSPGQLDEEEMQVSA